MLASAAIFASDASREAHGVPKLLAAGLSLRRNVLSDAAVDHIVGLVPTDEALWAPCIGQIEEFASKRCTLIPVDADVQRSLAAISATFGVDTSALDMLPIIRYLPGAPPVGVA